MINNFIKKGNELITPLQNDLRQIMWKYCGVVKNGDDLNKGLAEINRLKKQVLNIDVRIEDKNFIDLINLLDLKASLISAEATFMSAILGGALLLLNTPPDPPHPAVIKPPRGNPPEKYTEFLQKRFLWEN